MGKITEINAQKSNKKRASIFVDGKFVTGMESIVVAQKGIKVGDEIDEKELLQMTLCSLTAEAFDKSLTKLSSSMRTQREIERYLQSKEYPELVIKNVIEKLYEYKYLNDENYVKSYLSSFSSSRGIKKMKADLMAKGVNKELIENALIELGGQEEAARAQAEKYLRSHKKADKTGLCRYLYSKGFDYDVISSVADSATFIESGNDFFEE